MQDIAVTDGTHPRIHTLGIVVSGRTTTDDDSCKAVTIERLQEDICISYVATFRFFTRLFNYVNHYVILWDLLTIQERVI